uniref:Transcription repressor n=1 Tax=Kalanchoe fedtschenkoi TaxID=63787 RepID=A0A7N0UZU1_KALFE
MGNKPAKTTHHPEKKDQVLVKVVPPLDRAYVYWLTRDLERIHRFTPKKQQPVKPPDHCIEFMRLHGWLDLNLDDPDLAHLFKRKGIIRSLFTPKYSCGCSNPKLTDIINPKPKPKVSAHHHQMMLLNPLSSSSGSWERNGSTSRDQDDEPEEDYTSTTFSLTSAASSSEESGHQHPNTPSKAAPPLPLAVLGDSIAVEKHSVNPYDDFQLSILQMIVQKRIYLKSDLQELLNCFLRLNSPLHHHTIIKAFTDLLHNTASHAARNINAQPHRSESTPDLQMSTEQLKRCST